MTSGPIAYWRLSDPLRQSREGRDRLAALGRPSGRVSGQRDAWPATGPEPQRHRTPRRRASTGPASSRSPTTDVFELLTFTVEALVHPDSIGSGGGVIVGSMSPRSGRVGPGRRPAVVHRQPSHRRVFRGVGKRRRRAGGPLLEFDLAKLGTAWHLAMTFDGTELRLYWDGVQEPHGDSRMPRTRESRFGSASTSRGRSKRSPCMPRC